MSRVLWWVVLLLLTTNGCRDANVPDLVPVGGTVRLDGEPLSGALVEFHPRGDIPGNGGGGRTNGDGKYQLQTGQGHHGIPMGEYQVVIIKLVMPDGSDFPVDSDVPPIESSAKQVLPARYSDGDLTELRANVVAETETLDFSLESES